MTQIPTTHQPPTKPPVQQETPPRLRPSTLAAMRQMMQTYGTR